MPLSPRRGQEQARTQASAAVDQDDAIYETRASSRQAFDQIPGR